MPGYNLGFISDDDLYRHVRETVEKYRFDIDLKAFNKQTFSRVCICSHLGGMKGLDR